MENGTTPKSTKYMEHKSNGTLILAGGLVLALTVIFYCTAPKRSWSNDPITNTATAWSLGTRGTVQLDPYRDFLDLEGPAIIGVVHGKDGPVSQYPPGAAALASPLYALSGGSLTFVKIEEAGGRSLGVPPLWPAALVAAFSVATATVLVLLAVVRICSTAEALGAALVLAFGTGAWSVASQALWQHGPAMMWIALGLFLTARETPILGVSWAPAVLTRPHTLLIGGSLCAYQAWRERSPRRLFGLTGIVAGVALLSWFNWRIFGHFGVTGGYSQTSIGLSNPRRPPLLQNFVGALLDGQHGLLIYSPFLLLLIPGLKQAWRRSPSWVRGAALGSLAYLAVQYTLNRFSGGDRFFGYRYPIEALTGLAPLLVLSYVAWVRSHRIREITFWASFAVAASMQLVGILHLVPY